MRYVVTGAAGFIGSHLTEALLAAGHDVVPVDALTDYYDPGAKRRNAGAFELVVADLAEADLPPLLDGADGVFHLAGQPGVRASFGGGFPAYLRLNVLATQRLFEAAAAAGTRVVFASSSSVYGETERYPTPEETEPRPISPYGITKLACEHLADAYAPLGLDAVVLRYFTVYGPRQRPDMAFARLVAALAEGRTFELYGDGSASRGFTYVADAVSATIAAMEQGRQGATYNVGGGVEATLGEAIATLERISGRSLQVVRRERVTGDVRRTAADVSRIGADTGWEPTTPLEDGLRAHWGWASATVAAG